MAFSDEKAPIFVDTSLGTHMAMAVSRDITAGDLKRELGNEHSICFPNLGEVRITGLMVKRKSCFYHLPDSIRVKNVFRGLKGIWFLYTNVTPSNDFGKPCESAGLPDECRVSVSGHGDVTNSRKAENYIICTDKTTTGNKASTKKRKREGSLCFDGLLENFQRPVNIAKKEKRTKKCIGEKVVDENKARFLPMIEESPGVPLKGQSCHHDSLRIKDHNEGLISQSTVQTPAVSLSEAVSVSGIITRYFAEFDEVKSFDSPLGCDVNGEFGASKSQESHEGKPLKTEINEHRSKMVVHNAPQSTTKTPPATLSLPPPTEPNPRTSKSKFGRTEVGKRFLVAANDLQLSSKKTPLFTACKSKREKMSSLVKHLVFEIGESDDSSDSEVPVVHCSRNILVQSR